MRNLLEFFIGKATKIIYNGIQTGSGGAGNAAKQSINVGAAKDKGTGSQD